jgi:UDP-N-acetylglucosamine acyltransferase
MTSIDPTARIAETAVLGAGVTIGPYCIVGPRVSVGDGCQLIAHVYVTGHTEIGPRTFVHPFAALGGPPQSMGYKGEPTRLVIGADCTIRESVTMNTGTVAGGGLTHVGDFGHFMSFSHVAHDCRIGHNAVFASYAAVSGHCVLGDHVTMGGQSGTHQHIAIGSYAMVAGGSHPFEDIIPFGLAAGDRSRMIGINAVGMRRAGMTAASIKTVRAVYRSLFAGDGVLTERLERIEQDFGHDAAAAQILAFARSPRRRSLCQPRRKLASGIGRDNIDG